MTKEQITWVLYGGGRMALCCRFQHHRLRGSGPKTEWRKIRTPQPNGLSRVSLNVSWRWAVVVIFFVRNKAGSSGILAWLLTCFLLGGKWKGFHHCDIVAHPKYEENNILHLPFSSFRALLLIDLMLIFFYFSLKIVHYKSPGWNLHDSQWLMTLPFFTFQPPL